MERFKRKLNMVPGVHSYPILPDGFAGAPATHPDIAEQLLIESLQELL